MILLYPTPTILLSYYNILPTILLKGAENKKNKKILASNERQSSWDTGTILEYTNVPGTNQSGSSRDRHILYMHTSGVTVCVYSMLGPYYPCGTPEIGHTIWV